MSDRINISAKTVEEAVTKAMLELEATAEQLEYEVVEKGSNGILGGLIGSKPAVITAWKKKTVIEEGTDFLKKVFATMGMEVEIKVSYDEAEKMVSYNLEGAEMGVLIGKRGQTLDSLQHLVGLVINKNSEDYIRVKMDTENYRERRKETLEGLAKNIASKVKRTRRAVALEPMNPYERRIIHSTLQNDKYVYTKSEGEDPFRHVVIMLKKEAYPKTEGRKPYNKNFNKYRNSSSYNRSNSNNRYYYEEQKETDASVEE